MDLYTAHHTFRPTPPFDFAQSLSFIEQFSPMHGTQTVAGQSLTRAIRAAGHTLVFCAELAGSIEAPALACTLFAAEPVSPEVHAAAVDRIGFYLSLEDDLRPFYALAQADPAFARVAEQLYGYHQVKFTTPFENACWAVITQRNQWPVSRRMQQALLETFGTRLTVAGQAYGAFPDPEAMAVAPPEAIAQAIGHQPKGAFLSSVAHAFARADEGFLRTAPYAEVEAWLRSIKGIGPWSAGFILLRGLGRMERIPPGERWIAGLTAQRYGPIPVEQAAARYGPWQGYWAHYLRVAGDA